MCTKKFFFYEQTNAKKHSLIFKRLFSSTSNYFDEQVDFTEWIFIRYYGYIGRQRVNKLWLQRLKKCYKINLQFTATSLLSL